MNDDVKRRALVNKLKELIRRDECDDRPFDLHCEADEALIEFIDDKEISELYDNIPRFY